MRCVCTVLYIVEVYVFMFLITVFNSITFHLAALYFFAPQNGITPLFWASQEGHHAVVQTLLGAGAGVDVNVARSTVSGCTIL